MISTSLSLLVGAALPFLASVRGQEQNATAASQPYRSFNATP